jgi:uncharacterized protein (DUF2147 family)
MSLGFLTGVARVGFLAIVAAALSWQFAQAAPVRAEPSAAGLWEQVGDDGHVGGWFHIFERNGVYQGILVKAFARPNEKFSTVCTRCPGDQKNAPIVGLTIIKGMQRKGRTYENGNILDPRDGSIYSAVMEVSPDGQKLVVRGYLGIELFGQSQVWRRLADSAMPNLTDPSAPAQAVRTERPPAR